MPILDMPTEVAFVDSEFWMEANSLVFTSRLSKQVQTHSLSGSRWRATYKLPDMIKENAVLWEAFFNQLGGANGRFYAYDPNKKTPMGAATGTPLVDGADQTGTSLNTKGWTPSVTGILKSGDQVEVSGQLIQMTQDIDSDVSGNATLVFKAGLHSSPVDEAPLVVSNPKCVMRLVDDKQGKWSTGPTSIYRQKTFSAVEVIT